MKKNYNTTRWFSHFPSEIEKNSKRIFFSDRNSRGKASMRKASIGIRDTREQFMWAKHSHAIQKWTVRK